MRLDNLIEQSAVHGGRWNVRRVATIEPQLVDVVARSLVLLLQNSRITWKTFGADEVGVDGTSIIRANGNVISDRLLSRSEVLECPLDIDVALGPAND